MQTPEGTEKHLDEAAQVRYLRPEEMEFSRGEGGSLRLTLKDDRTLLVVAARRCFPLAEPSRFISVRDGAGNEAGIIPDLADLTPEARDLVRDVLNLVYYTPRITQLKSLRHRWGGVEWQVETDHGSRRFITKGVHDTMAEVQPGRYIISDVDGNRYELRADDLDAPSRTLLDRLV